MSAGSRNALQAVVQLPNASMFMQGGACLAAGSLACAVADVEEVQAQLDCFKGALELKGDGVAAVQLLL